MSDVRFVGYFVRSVLGDGPITSAPLELFVVWRRKIHGRPVFSRDFTPEALAAEITRLGDRAPEEYRTALVKFDRDETYAWDRAVDGVGQYASS